MTKLCLTPSFLVLWHAEAPACLTEPGVLRRELPEGATLGAQVCLRPVDCQPPRMPLSPLGRMRPRGHSQITHISENMLFLETAVQRRGGLQD